MLSVAVGLLKSQLAEPGLVLAAGPENNPPADAVATVDARIPVIENATSGANKKSRVAFEKLLKVICEVPFRRVMRFTVHDPPFGNAQGAAKRYHSVPAVTGRTPENNVSWTRIPAPL